MTDDDPEETILYQSPPLVTITKPAYDSLQADAALQERLAILAYLRSARQPMQHTARALAREIEMEAHLK